MNQYKFVIPPRFARKIEQFRVHCQVALQKPTARLAPTEDHRDPLPKPIMIVGPTGVGKTLFLTIFKKLYRDNYPDDKKHPIVEANCAHFGGDHNMIRSELFGHVKGAFTGALYNKVGVVAAANNGLLILEEIGDLPPETQAMLLSFIETGEYYRVGDEYTKEGRPNPKKAYVQIVSATNRENVIRGDLKYRFFPFYVPPLHERRHDILYYLHAKYPELIGTLTPSEVLALLSHNWPGNVREIERVGWLLTREKLLRSSLLSSNYEDPYRLFKIRSQEMDLNLEFIANISMTPDVNSGHEIFSCSNLPCIELPLIDSRG